MTDMTQLYNETRKLSILLVEDHEPLRSRTLEIFQELFVIADAAEDGLEGLEKYRAYHTQYGRPYDLVVTDIQMPRMDGIELVAEVYDIYEEQPVIVLSAHSEREYLLALINFGVAQFISKPIVQDELFAALHKTCRKINTKTGTASPTHCIKLSARSTWNLTTQVLTVDGAEQSLTYHEILLFDILSSQFEHVCSVDMIINHFFMQEIDLNVEGLRNLVARLRKKLESGNLVSIYGFGYKLSAI